MGKELISVIVPVYRVEKYLEKCVRSIMNQSYKNLEIILIDDGSPDQCGMICDRLGSEDARIRVIHQNNMGQSASRNAGLAIATGNYIGFVDSDDYLDEDMYEYLYSLIHRQEADISMCAFRKYSEEYGVLEKEDATEVVTFCRDEAMKALVEDHIMGSQPCNKLFKRSLFDGILFPVGKVYEDIAIMHLVFWKASKVVLSTEKKYNYLIRSTSTSYIQNAEWGYGLFSAFRDRFIFVKKNYPELMPICMEKVIGIAIGMYIHWQRFKKDEPIKLWEKEVRQFLKDKKQYVWFSKQLTLHRKVDGVIIIYFPILVKVKYGLYYVIRSGVK